MISKLKLNSKCISPVVATSLLLIVAVSAVVFFQGWFSDFSSSVLVDIEGEISKSSAVRVEGVVNDNLYLKSFDDGSLKLLVVKDNLGNDICSFTSGNSNVLDSGVVGDWRFDDYNSTIKDYSSNSYDGKLFGDSVVLLDMNNDANDLSSYLNNGFVNGSTLISSNCISGGCYEFDGINDYIEIFEDDSFDFSRSDNFSVSFWFRGMNKSGSVQQILTKGLSTRYPFKCEISGSGSVYCAVYDGADGSNIYYMNLTNTMSDWNHIVFIKDEDKILGYLNGDFIGENDISLIGEFNNNVSLFLGTRHSYNYPFNGSLDEVAIYSRALNLNEVKNLYNSKKVEFVEFVEGGLEFDGVNDFVNVSAAVLPLTGDFSVLLKVKPYSYKAPLVGNSIIFSQYVAGDFNRSVIEYNGVTGKPSIFINNESDNLRAESNKSTPLLKTDYIVVSHNESENKIHFYVDGELQSSINYSGQRLNTNTIFGIGDGLDKKLYSFHGLISQIKVFDKSLNSDDVKFLSSPDLNLIGSSLNKIDLSSCNLQKGQNYNVLVGDDTGLNEKSVIVK